MSHRSRTSAALPLLLLGAWVVHAVPVMAQTAQPPAQVHDGSHDHSAMEAADASGLAASDMPAGQAAFAAIAAVVETLDADPATDWSKVNIEALRQHLMDMDMVLMESRVVMEELADGARFRVSGDGGTRGAIRRMTLAHARALDAMAGFRASAAEAPDGATLDVRATDGSSAGVARIRGLGYAGLLTLGSHHGPHHLMIARGQRPTGH